MGRPHRNWNDYTWKGYHLVFRIVNREFLMKDQEKELIFSIIQDLIKGYYVLLHAFVIMDNHVHLLISPLIAESKKASFDELIDRYQAMIGKKKLPPQGSFDHKNEFHSDPDYGEQRLRSRLGNPSRFMQDLKGKFSRLYNKKHNRKGCLWEGRFHSETPDKKDGELSQAAYIELNPVRAGMVQMPEDYRWSSLGLRVGNPSLAKKILSPLQHPIFQKSPADALAAFRVFVYQTGGVKKERQASIPTHLVEEVTQLVGRLGLKGRLAYRIKNFSKGMAIGSAAFIAHIQKNLGRKHIKPRRIPGTKLYTTRVYSSDTS